MGTCINPNEFFQAGPFATKLFPEGLTVYMNFQTLDLIPALKNEAHGSLDVLPKIQLRGIPRWHLDQDEEGSFSAKLELVGQHGQVLTTNVDIGPHSTVGTKDRPPSMTDARQRYELIQIVGRKVESSSRKPEDFDKYFVVKIIDGSRPLSFTSNPSVGFHTELLVD